MVDSRDAETRARHVAHRGDVGVVEHHALRLAGRPAGVDQQRQRVGSDVGGRPVGGRLRRERVDVDDCGVELEAVADHDLGACVIHLILHLGRSERGVHGRRRCAQTPGREEGDDQLDPVRHCDRNDIAGADAEAVEQRGRAGDAVGERGVVECDRVVGERGRVRLGAGARLREVGQGDVHDLGGGHRFLVSIAGPHIGTYGRPAPRPMGAGDEVPRRVVIAPQGAGLAQLEATSSASTAAPRAAASVSAHTSSTGLWLTRRPISSSARLTR